MVRASGLDRGPLGRPLSRRRFLEGTAGAFGAFALGGALGACDDDGGGGRASDRLRVAASGLPSATTLDPRRAGPGASFVVLFHLYDSLMRLEGGRYVLRLAESVEPNRDGTRWTVRLRTGPRFHDGSPVRAEDVVYSLRTIGDPLASPALSTAYADVNLSGLRARDARTVEIPLRRPRGDFAEAVLGMSSMIFPAGTRDFERPIGSGPFRLVEHDPGKSVRLAAHDEYWDGAPKIRRLDVITVLDPAARVNGVKSDQVDYAVAISPTAARAERRGGEIEIHRGGPQNGNALVFAMNQALDPFGDARVRAALRLAVDRRQLVEHVLFGFGSVGNDLVGKDLPGYAADLPQRERDVDEAGRLLAQAGVRSLAVRAADLLPGLVDASRLLAQQLAEAGLELDVQQAEAGSYFADIQGVLTTPLQAFYFVNRPPAAHLASVIGPRAQWNLMGYTDTYGRRLTDAQATVDDDARREKFAALQRELHEQGAEVVWGFQEQLDASRPGIEGVTLSQSVPLFDRATVS